MQKEKRQFIDIYFVCCSHYARTNHDFYSNSLSEKKRPLIFIVFENDPCVNESLQTTKYENPFHLE